jgi:hypothetical protein
MTVLILPTVALLALRRRSELPVLAAAAATVFVPVLISTASGQETQASRSCISWAIAFAAECAARKA